jgi:hypothetical protein
MALDAQDVQRSRRRSGYLNSEIVKAVAFWITAICIFVAVAASLLAIWEFTGTDVLWRTVASCVVIAGGTVAFTIVNGVFGRRD